MASKDPFLFSRTKVVAPIPCVECGNNMHCFRRTPVRSGERRWFHCAGCSNEIERTVGVEPSDAAVQAEAEQRSGVSPKR